MAVKDNLTRLVVDNEETSACKIAAILQKLADEILNGDRTPSDLILLLAEPQSNGMINFHREAWASPSIQVALYSMGLFLVQKEIVGD